MVFLCLTAGGALSVLFVLKKNLAARSIGYLWACSYDRNPVIGNPSLPFTGWLLSGLLPDSANHRGIPGRFSCQIPRRHGNSPPDLYLAAWVLLSPANYRAGYTELVSRINRWTALLFSVGSPIQSLATLFFLRSCSSFRAPGS
jgi:hypothetical protein